MAYIQGWAENGGTNGSLQMLRIIPTNSKAANPAFDVTPARLVTGIITEKGVFAPDQLNNIN